MYVYPRSVCCLFGLRLCTLFSALAFQFSGRHQFLLDLKRLRKLLQPLDGSEVKVTAQLVDSVLQVSHCEDQI